MRLHVCVLGAKKSFRTFDGEPLDAVNILAAAVISFARIAFGIFVGEHGAGGFQHSFRNKIFRSDELKPGRLPPHFIAQASATSGSTSSSERLIRTNSGLSFVIHYTRKIPVSIFAHKDTRA